MSATSPSQPPSAHDPGVQAYFERGSARWDTIYDNRKRNLKEWAIDRFFHGTIQHRFEIVIEALAPYEGKRILDIGCGSGRYSVEFAVRGAREVVGLDFAASMLELARQNAQERGVADRCRWVEGDFLDWAPEGSFEGVVSIGFFEYQRDVQALFDRIAAFTHGTIAISFPIDAGFRAAVRKWRYAYNKCYLRFFTEAELHALVHQCPVKITRHEIKRTDRDFVLLVETP